MYTYFLYIYLYIQICFCNIYCICAVYLLMIPLLLEKLMLREEVSICGYPKFSQKNDVELRSSFQLVQDVWKKTCLKKIFLDDFQAFSNSCVLSCCFDRLGAYPTWWERKSSHTRCTTLLQKPLLKTYSRYFVWSVFFFENHISAYFLCIRFVNIFLNVFSEVQ